MPSTREQRRDAVRLLRILVGECNEGATGHAWRRCRRCVALHQLQNHDPLATRLLRTAIEALDVLVGDGREARERCQRAAERIRKFRLDDSQMWLEHHDTCEAESALLDAVRVLE